MKKCAECGNDMAKARGVWATDDHKECCCRLCHVIYQERFRRKSNAIQTLVMCAACYGMFPMGFVDWIKIPDSYFCCLCIDASITLTKQLKEQGNGEAH